MNMNFIIIDIFIMSVQIFTLKNCRLFFFFKGIHGMYVIYQKEGMPLESAYSDDV